MNEFKDWKSWWEERQADLMQVRRKTIPADRRYNDEAWREVFGGAPDAHVHMILHDFPEDEYIVYMIPQMSDSKGVGVYDMADFEACDIKDGRPEWFYRLKKVRHELGYWIFQPEYAVEHSYEKNVEYINPLSGEKTDLDKIEVKFWKVDDELARVNFLGLKVVFSEYVRWSKINSAVYKDQEVRLYQPMQNGQSARKAKRWLEYERDVLFLTHFYKYIRNEDGVMELDVPSFTEKLHKIPNNLGKADIVSFPAKE